MSVLDEIVAGVREDLAVREAARPLDEVKAEAANCAGRHATPPRCCASTQASPSSPRSSARRRPRARWPTIADPAALARQYAAGGAAAISVLTEERRFGGSLDDLRAVRDAVDVPVLRKDFIVTSYQLWEAREAGADLVLLIVAALEQPALVSLVERAESLGLTPLVEVHDTDEVERAVDAGARLIGVNARDLTTLEVDPTTFARVAPSIPDDVLRVAESGIRVAGRRGRATPSRVRTPSSWVRRSSSAPTRAGAVAELVAAGAHPTSTRGSTVTTDLDRRHDGRACGLRSRTPPVTGVSSAGASSPRRLSPPSTSSPRPSRPARVDPGFLAELDHLQRTYTGRPSPLTDATRLSEHAGGARILLKREDLNHTGSHKINNVLGQALLTRRMGKTRVIAETGAGQHGVATATACALLGLECVVYMGEEDTRRQALNVVADAAARCRGGPGHQRVTHPQGRHQRGDA